MLKKTFSIQVKNHTIELSSHCGKSDGTATVKLEMKCPGTIELTAFEAHKLAKGLRDTIDFGDMIGCTQSR